MVGLPLTPTLPSASDASKLLGGLTDPSQRPGFTTDVGHARTLVYYNDIFLGLSGPEVTQEAGYGLAEESDLHPMLVEPSYPPEGPGQDTLITDRTMTILGSNHTRLGFHTLMP